MLEFTVHRLRDYPTGGLGISALWRDQEHAEIARQTVERAAEVARGVLQGTFNNSVTTGCQHTRYVGADPAIALQGNQAVLERLGRAKSRARQSIESSMHKQTPAIEYKIRES